MVSFLLPLSLSLFCFLLPLPLSSSLICFFPGLLYPFYLTVSLTASSLPTHTHTHTHTRTHSLSPSLSLSLSLFIYLSISVSFYLSIYLTILFYWKLLRLNSNNYFHYPSSFIANNLSAHKYNTNSSLLLLILIPNK